MLKRGQGVLNIVPLGGCKDEVDAAILEMPATGGSGVRGGFPATGPRRTATG